MAMVILDCQNALLNLLYMTLMMMIYNKYAIWTCIKYNQISLYQVTDTSDQLSKPGCSEKDTNIFL